MIISRTFVFATRRLFIIFSSLPLLPLRLLLAVVVVKENIIKSHLKKHFMTFLQCEMCQQLSCSKCKYPAQALAENRRVLRRSLCSVCLIYRVYGQSRDSKGCSLHNNPLEVTTFCVVIPEISQTRVLLLNRTAHVEGERVRERGKRVYKREIE